MNNLTAIPIVAQPLRFFRLWQWLGVAGLILILILTLVPMPPMPLDVDYLDKWQHAVTFSLLMLYAGMLFPAHCRWAALGLLLYGAKIELLQMLLPWRSAEWLDLFADLAGILLGWLLLNTPIRRLLGLMDAALAAAVRAMRNAG